MKNQLSDELLEKVLSFLDTPRRYHHFHLFLRKYMLSTRFQTEYGFEKFLLDNKHIRRFFIDSDFTDPVKIFSKRTKTKHTVYEIANALHPKSYFCNLTSIFYHGLTNQVPNVVFIAEEKKRDRDSIEKVKNIKLSDYNIRTAFFKPHRILNNYYEFRDRQIQFNNRVFRNNIGVEAVSDDSIGKKFQITCLERALIDAVINPQYNGGIASVVQYFAAAKRIKVEKFIKIYSELHFIYPYWQAIGLIANRLKMEKLSEKLYTSFEIKNKFYLDHMAKSSWNFDEKWQVHYPGSLFDENR